MKKIQQKLQNLDFTQRVLILSIGLTGTALTLIGLLVYNSFTQFGSQAVNRYASTLLIQTAQLSAEPLASNDLISLNVIIKELTSHNDISSAAIYGRDDQLLAERGTGEYPLRGKQTPYQIFTTKITYNNSLIGQLRFSLSTTPIVQATQALLIKFTLAAITAIFFISGVFYLLSHTIRASLKSANKALTRFPQETLYKHKSQLPIIKLTELDTLHQSISSLYRKHINETQLNKALHRFTSPLQERNSVDLPEDYAHISMLYIDIANFNEIRKTTQPEELTELLNAYYHYINQACMLYNGKVDNFHGDGVMVLFGASHKDVDDNFNAVCAGQLLIQLLTAFNAQRTESNLPIIEFQFGIHYGLTLINSIERDGQHFYRVMGDNVNLSARVARSANVNQLLITHQVLQASDLEDRIYFAESGCVLQGDSELTTYAVKALNEEYESLLKQQIRHIMTMSSDEIG
jgi:class 3 adenylate cyclase/uncharacterized membrane protein affecting hemolysin expression